MTQPKPTESELEILNILWEKGASTVREIHEVLEQTKESGYTTTLKLLQIMHDKKLVKHLDLFRQQKEMAYKANNKEAFELLDEYENQVIEARLKKNVVARLSS